MDELINLLQSVQPLDAAAVNRAKKRWDSVAKPLGSLGKLEDAVVKIAGILSDDRFSIEKRGVVVMCADNGVVAQGVTQTSSEVTAVVARNFVSGETSVCKMAQIAGADVIPVDIGVKEDLSAVSGILHHRISPGTEDITCGPAMTQEQAVDAVLYGISLVGQLKKKGYRLLATGEMGIGNTTTSSALASVLLGRSPAEMVGRGAGLSSEGLTRKRNAVERAIAVNHPVPERPLEAAAKVGGLDICGLMGVFLGGAVHRIPIVIDGFISATSALAAKSLCPKAGDYWLASHLSDEPACSFIFEALGLSPCLHCSMRLGEGTGAVAFLPLLDMAKKVYDEMSTFAQIKVEQYQPLE